MGTKLDFLPLERRNYGIYAYANLEKYNLTKDPKQIYNTLHAISTHYDIIGMNSIYNLTTKGFTRCLRYSAGTDLNADIA
jgi:hypothetical protein